MYKKDLFVHCWNFGFLTNPTVHHSGMGTEMRLGGSIIDELLSYSRRKIYFNNSSVMQKNSNSNCINRFEYCNISLLLTNKIFFVAFCDCISVLATECHWLEWIICYYNSMIVVSDIHHTQRTMNSENKQHSRTIYLGFCQTSLTF